MLPSDEAVHCTAHLPPLHCFNISHAVTYIIIYITPQNQLGKEISLKKLCKTLFSCRTIVTIPSCGALLYLRKYINLVNCDLVFIR